VIRKRKRVLLVGWDAADWKVARPLMARGQMPHLARLVAGGASGNIATMEPPLSPMLWTSIATGKRPGKHGIHGFSEPTPDGQAVRPVTILGRTTKAVWNILNQNGIRPSVVGWWPSHPAEPVNGVIVSNHAHQAGEGPTPRPLLPGAVHPREWCDRLAELRITPMELGGEEIRIFVPEYQRVDQDADKRLHSLGKVIAETMSLHAMATEVLEHAQWDFAAIYYDAIDHFCHGFMQYHPPRLPWIDAAAFDIYQHVIAAAYRLHDMMLGRLLQLAGPDTTVILMSDHGFHPDALRPGYIPAEAAGPAVEHRSFGMITLNGPGIKAGQTLYGSSLLDIAPTILHLYGLPVGRDMDGKVLVTALADAGPVAAIPSWDEVPGDAGLHPPGAMIDPVAASEAMKQLVALGYVAPPGEDAAQAVADCVAELQYNLARAHDDAGRFDLSLPLYETLSTKDPDDHRYVERLIETLITTGDTTGALAVLDAFDARCATTAPAAQADLTRRRAVKPDSELKGFGDDQARRELFERRQLAEQATGFGRLRQVLRLQVDLACGHHEEARQTLQAVERLYQDVQRPPALFLAGACEQVGNHAGALTWIERALQGDPDDWRTLALSARINLRSRRFAAALDAAAASLALIYFQPMTHYVMGRALMARGDAEGAERALKVALAQMPGLIAAHQALARLYSSQIRTEEAATHRARAAELRAKVKHRRAAELAPKPPKEPAALIPFTPRAGPSAADPQREVVVVAGLPRSGTSMLMQLLAAGGVQPLTDGQRLADADNPRGYFEFAPAVALARDAAWVPQARGKAVKLALPLLPHLPPGESYRLIIIERDLRDVIASQRAMLQRLDRSQDAAALNDDALAAEYTRLRERVRRWLEGRPEIAVLPVQYETVLTDARGTASRLAAFLARPFDAQAAGNAVDPALRRHGVNKART